MAYDTDRLLQLWSEPLPEGPAAEDLFRAVYTDPVTVNGSSLGAADLVARAKALQATFEHAEREILDVCETDHKVALAFRMSGRQVGPLGTTAGVLQPTGTTISLRVIDILTLDDAGRITKIVMVADELGALTSAKAVELVQP